MNRSALCIQMLHILYGRNQPISRKELAELLETNLRNIAEFKKELEIAGYLIDSTPGRYGGYVLNEASVFPSLSLEAKEKEAINEALTYLKAQKNFIDYSSFAAAMNKVKAKHKNLKQNKETIYVSDAKNTLHPDEIIMLDKIKEAKEQNNTISFAYLSNHSDQFSIRKVQPYEMIVTNDGFYLLAYDITKNKEHIYKYFKIINERMKDVEILAQSFTKDSSFKVQNYIGKKTLMKDLFEVELEVYGKQARLVNEKELENTITKTFHKDVLYIHFMMEGKWRLKNFILSLGKDCKVLSPISIQDEIIQELNNALLNYK